MGYKTNNLQKTNKYNTNKLHKTTKHKKSRKNYVGSGPNQEPNVPTLRTNTSKAINIVSGLINNFIASNIDSISKKLKIDPNDSAANNIKILTKNVKLILAALNTPEGEALKQELKALLKEMVLILEPSVQEAIRILDENGPKIAASIDRIIVGIYQEILPPTMALNALSNLAAATFQTSKAVVDVTGVGAETAIKLTPMAQDLKTIGFKIDDFINKAVDTGNDITSGFLNFAQDRVNKSGEELLRQRQLPPFKQLTGGKNINALHDQKTLIGGRIQTSIDEFMA